MGPFLLVSLTNNGNATVHADDNGNRQGVKLYDDSMSVRRERLVPYRYEYRCYYATTPINNNNITPAATCI